MIIPLITYSLSKILQKTEVIVYTDQSLGLSCLGNRTA
jgi:hypothetical protein